MTAWHNQGAVRCDGLKIAGNRSSFGAVCGYCFTQTIESEHAVGIVVTSQGRLCKDLAGEISAITYPFPSTNSYTIHMCESNYSYNTRLEAYPPIEQWSNSDPYSSCCKRRLQGHRCTAACSVTHRKIMLATIYAMQQEISAT
jgi:hypothetical protein